MLPLLISFITSLSSPTGDVAFDFYIGELRNNLLEEKHRMKLVIQEGLVDSILQADSNQEFRFFLDELRISFEENPARYKEYERISRRLEREFESLLKKAKQQRLLYSAAGAVVGALVALPVSCLIAGQWISKALWIAVPAGVLAGGGAGFLLGNLTLMPAYDFYENYNANEDLHLAIENLGLDD